MDNEEAVLLPLHRLHGHHAESHLPMSVLEGRDPPVGEQLRESPANDQPISICFRLTHTFPITKQRVPSRSPPLRPFPLSNANYHPMRKKKAGSGIQYAGVESGRS